MKKKKLVKQALQHPELYSNGDLAYFELWLKTKQERKEVRKQTQLEQDLAG